MTIRPENGVHAIGVPVPKLSLTTLEAARSLGISPRKLHDMTFPRGPIRCARAGRVRLYPIPELQRFLTDSAASGQR